MAVVLIGDVVILLTIQGLSFGKSLVCIAGALLVFIGGIGLGAIGLLRQLEKDHEARRKVQGEG